MQTISYPHTIDNGLGERLTFLRRVPGVLGQRGRGFALDLNHDAGHRCHCNRLVNANLAVDDGVRAAFRMSLLKRAKP